ncbi:sigma-70 family RNA polymerase sigma factor [Brevibacillus laterosporus]|nr:sigma-70 family RNA polymerase sigma factor [Brevibacillus laterosporus]MDN9010846.1 sigma-70 family RNA polymerase sigma factor [Brevibacillus laterosporus]MDO0941869.1 sigma-70 family RNA polymerase sigma factor [Brevibacillus laterosporus]
MSSVFVALSLLFKELVMFVAYVKNNAFPQPLPEVEEEKYLKLMATGDPIARNKLIEHNLRLVAHIVKKFENTGEDSEDLISIGTIGLIKAIESYQVNKGTKLATYAARCIENDILLSLVMRILIDQAKRVCCRTVLLLLSIKRSNRPEQTSAATVTSS